VFALRAAFVFVSLPAGKAGLRRWMELFPSSDRGERDHSAPEPGFARRELTTPAWTTHTSGGS